MAEVQEFQFDRDSDAVREIRRLIKDYDDGSGWVTEAPIVVLVPMMDNRVLLAVATGAGDGSPDKTTRKLPAGKSVDPATLSSTAIFVGKGSGYVNIVVDGVSYSIWVP